MKLKRIQLILLILGIVVHSYAMSNDDPDEKKETKANIEWEKTSYDFGKIVKNAPAVVEFKFKNKSMVPLLINSVRPTCGCTVADYPREPVQPGESASITVRYNTRAIGHFTKSIIVNSNTNEGEARLIIKGEVIDTN